MRQILSVLATNVGLTATPALRLVAALFTVDRRPYRPERHYMRGPGPKWRGKQAGMALADSEAMRTSAGW